MPEGSLLENIQILQQAISAVTGLLGESPQEGSPGSGFAGAADLASFSLGDRVGEFQDQLTGRIREIFNFDPTNALSSVTEFFNTLKTQMQEPPTQMLEGFVGQISEVNSVFLGDFSQQLQQTFDAVRQISSNVPENRTAIVSSMLDQILGFLASLEGPEAERIQSWIQTLQEMHRGLMPLIEQAQSAPDPSSVVIAVVQRSLDSTLEAFGFNKIKRLMDFLDDFPGSALPEAMLNDLSSAITSVSSAYGQIQGVAGSGNYAQFHDIVKASLDAMQDLKEQLRPFMGIVRRIAQVKIFQPNALESFLRNQLETALSVQVQEVQKIDDPFKELFDRIDEAIEGIDLEFVRTEVLDFFENTRNIIEQVNIASIGEFIQQQLNRVQETVSDLQQGVTNLLSQIEGFFDDLTQQYRDLAGNIGTFQPDGTFQYNFEQDLRNLFTSARLAIGGDPQDPSAPSLSGLVEEFQSYIDQFLNQIKGFLQPVESAINEAKEAAVSGINTFSGYLQGLNVAQLIEQLRVKVEEIVDALLPIDFDLVVDPVVEQIEENTQKLHSVDTESLNDMLREALKIALDVIIKIDFTSAISTPLKDGFAQVKAVPENAIQQLQERYEQAMAFLDELKPEKLLEALFSAFDIIEKAVSSLDVTTLLQPLDELHEQYLKQPLGQLKPSTLLQPVSDLFQELTSVFDEFRGSAIIEPINTQLNTLKAGVADIDMTSWIDDLLAAVEKVKQDLRNIRPSEIFQPLVADFERLESELDRFKPSVVFQPAAQLAAPLLQFLETIQQDTIDALYGIFQAPVQILDRLQPDRLTQHIQQQIDGVIEELNRLNLPAGYNQLKGEYFDLKQAVEAQGVDTQMALMKFIDPDRHLGELVDTYNDLISAIEALKQNVQIPDLAGLYEELRQRLMAMLPPYARQLLDSDTFKRLMRLADPTRFLEELDERFEALKNRLIPIRPQDITAQLDETYDTVLALVDGLSIDESLNQVKELFNQIKGIVEGIRIDFLAADIDNAIDDFRALVDALDPARFFTDLDGIHHDVELVVQDTLPSQMLSGLQEILDEVQGIVGSVNPRTLLGPPLEEAWESVKDVLDEIDFTIILSPIIDKLDELEQEFEAGLRRTETAFDQMLSSAKGALSGGSQGASAGVTMNG